MPSTLVTSSTNPNTKYKVADGCISCSCPAWRYQRLPPAMRHCKHTRQVCPDKASLTHAQAMNMTSRPPFMLVANSPPAARINNNDYVASIKHDGIRVAVNTHTGTVVSRSGWVLPIAFPDLVQPYLPLLIYDAELIAASSEDNDDTTPVTHNDVMKLIMNGVDTSKFALKVFDIIDTTHVFAERYGTLKKHLPPQYLVTQHRYHGDVEDIFTRFPRIEGVVVRQKQHMYVPGSRRNQSMFKIKNKR
jgi:ATP-dependent DNA ligase